MDKLKPKGLANALFVAFAVELRREYSRAGNGAENAQIKNEKELIYNSDARHLFGADLTDHDVVEQVDELRNAVLEHNGKRDRKNGLEEIFIADIFFNSRHGEHSIISGE